MPRAVRSKIGEVVAFFRTASLEVMEIGFDLVNDVVKERQGKSAQARARAQETPAGTTAGVTTGVPRKASKTAKGARKKPGPKPKAKVPTTPASMVDLPLDAVSEGDMQSEAEADAGDAPGSTLVAP